MTKFYICRHCGNFVQIIHDSQVPMICCGEKMTELKANTSDGAGEKHLPIVHLEDGAINVNVGEIDHPMVPEHFIEWIYVETDKGGYRHDFQPNDEPNVSFAIPDEKVVAVYAYCNLHGLWMTQL